MKNKQNSAKSSSSSCVRLDKFLADLQLGTRSQVKQLIRKGQIRINGEIIKQADCKVNPLTDRICLDDRLLSLENLPTQQVYFLLNKPAGVVSATVDNRDRTVLDLIQESDRRPDLFPVGRLDKDTVGLLLITNDGALSHRLLSPRHHVDKTYFVRVQGDITAETVSAFEKGLDIGDEKPTLPARLIPTGTFPCQEARVTIREGRFHQIKRMFHAVGCEVLYLKRLSMGTLHLDASLPEGSYRPLTRKELEQLKTDGTSRTDRQVQSSDLP